MKLLLFFYFIFFTLTGCIHFTLGDSSPQKANNIEFSAPPSPFSPMKEQNADRSWQSKKTGNIISLFSDCSKSSDKPLPLALNDILKGFDRIDEQKESTIFYNNREALQIQIKGVIDGISVFLESVIFNKNQCFYQITYSGVLPQYEAEKSFFENFKMELKAP